MACSCSVLGFDPSPVQNILVILLLRLRGIAELLQNLGRRKTPEHPLVIDGHTTQFYNNKYTHSFISTIHTH